MKIVKEYPPIYDDIIASGMRPCDKTFFTYGDTLYNPHDVNILSDFIAHEETHSRQQGDNPDSWWNRYLDDPYFRIDQEAEAYARQYEFICKTVKDREKRFRTLVNLGGVLASPLYGSVVGREMARKLIKSKVKE